MSTVLTNVSPTLSPFLPTSTNLPLTSVPTVVIVSGDGRAVPSAGHDGAADQAEEARRR